MPVVSRGADIRAGPIRRGRRADMSGRLLKEGARPLAQNVAVFDIFHSAALRGFRDNASCWVYTTVLVVVPKLRVAPDGPWLYS